MIETGAKWKLALGLEKVAQIHVSITPTTTTQQPRAEYSFIHFG